MKKALLLLPLISFLSLAGCDASDDNGDNGDAGSDALPYNDEQAKNKLRELGESDGVEITYEVTDNETETDTLTFGLKGNVAWNFEGNDKVVLSYNETTKAFDYSTWNATESKYETETVPDADKTVYNSYIDAYTGMFFFATSETYGLGSFKKVGDVKFAGRNAIEYKYQAGIAGIAAASIKVVIDKELGITLLWDGKAYGDGDSGSAKFEVKTFKTGSSVTVPSVE